MEDLKERCKKFIEEVGVMTKKFCDNAGIGRSTYYMWQSNHITISDDIKKSIDTYLKKFGY